MAVENWIDEICKLWEVDDGKGGKVKSYRVYEKAEFPAALSVYPCAITYTVDVIDHYSAGASYDLWNGKSEFHFQGIDKSRYPAMMLFFARIRDAAAGSLSLGGKVAHFKLRTPDEGGPSIQGPVMLQYGSEDPHDGLVIYWRVKEMVSVTVSA